MFAQVLMGLVEKDSEEAVSSWGAEGIDPLGPSKWPCELPAEGMEGDSLSMGSHPPLAKEASRAFSVAHFWVGQPLGVPHTTASGCVSSQGRRTEVGSRSHTPCPAASTQSWSESARNWPLQKRLE